MNNFGLSNKKETLVLYTPVSDMDLSGIASIYNRKNTTDFYNNVQEQLVKLEVLDEYCLDNNIKNIDLLKLDVEGHELAVLEGAKSMIQQNRIKFIQFEFGGCNIDSRTFFLDFWSLYHNEYYFYRICANGLRKIHEYSTEKNEIFSSINYLLERKN